jgi:flagellar biosynthetic protein FliR
MFSSPMIPTQFRVLLVLALSAMMLPAALPLLHADLTLGQAVVGLAGEALLGVILGLAASAVFVAAQLAGQFVSQQAGLSLGEVFNPLFETESSALQELWFWITLVLFLTAGGAHAVVSVLLGSFTRVPPLAWGAIPQDRFGPALADVAAGTLDLAFQVALRLAGPTMIALLLSTLAMGFIVRTMPQFNVLSVGFSVKVFLAFLVTALAMTRGGEVIADALHQSADEVRALLDGLAGGLAHAR